MRHGSARSSWILVCGLLVAGLIGCQANPGFDFDVTADMRKFTPPEYPGPDYFAGACAALDDVGAGAFMVVVGDLDPPRRVRATLDATLGEDYVWYPVVGNHELDRPEYMPYLREVNAGGKTLPGVVRSGPPGGVETCYSFDHGNAHFVIMNQYYDGQSDTALDGDVSDALYEWLATDLAATDREFVFVFGHEPSVAVPDLTSGRVRHRGDSLDQYPERNHRFWSLLREHGVVAYICGHTHNASVAWINEVWQIDAGHARGVGDPGAPSTFLKFHVRPGHVSCDVYRRADDGVYRHTLTQRLR